MGGGVWCLEGFGEITYLELVLKEVLFVGEFAVEAEELLLFFVHGLEIVSVAECFHTGWH